MAQLALHRLLLSVPTLLLVSFLVFGMMRLNPDSVAAARLGEGYTPAQAVAVEHEYGLDKPLPSEYVKWLTKLLRGDWGVSAVSKQHVLGTLPSRIAVT